MMRGRRRRAAAAGSSSAAVPARPTATSTEPTPGEPRHRAQVLLALLAVGLFLPAAAGCGPVARGTLAGTVRTYGGPERPGGGMALNGKPTPGSKVYARSGSTVTTVTSDASGRFAFHLTPGRYTLTCDGPFTGDRSQPVEVRSNAQASADCRVDMP